MKKHFLQKKIFLLFTALVFTASSLFANNGFLSCLENNNASRQKTLVILYKDGCPYCEQMNNAISSDQPLQQLLTTNFRIYSLDINSAEGQNFANQFDVHAVPTIINFNNETGEHNIIKGFGGRQRFLRELTLEESTNQPIETVRSFDKPSNEILAAVCGNGVVESGEQCDDGNNANGDGCTGSCTIQAGYQCTGSPSACTPLSVCGNGFVEAGEQCDDGNNANGDGCTGSCTIQAGYQCVGNPSACTPLAVCGNGFVEAGEQCDDGNNANGDGCTGSCTIQPGYQCAGNPSACTLLAVCGNGTLEIGEQCDDGNTANGDGCSGSCTLENGDGAILIKKGAGTPDYSAMLDVNSTQRGILIPRMTTVQRTAIKSPAVGLMVFDASTNSFWYFGGSGWKEIKSDAMNAAFSANIPSIVQNTSPGSSIFVSFAGEDFDDGGNNYSTGTSSYTVPATGVYEFSATVSININSSPAAATSYSVYVYESVGFTTHAIGSSTIVIPAGYVGNTILSTTGTVKLTAGTGGLVRVTLSSSPNSLVQPIATGKFSGHRVY